MTSSTIRNLFMFASLDLVQVSDRFCNMMFRTKEVHCFFLGLIGTNGRGLHIERGWGILGGFGCGHDNYCFKLQKITNQKRNTFAMSAKKNALRQDPLEKPQDSQTNGSVTNFAIARTLLIVTSKSSNSINKSSDHC